MVRDLREQFDEIFLTIVAPLYGSNYLYYKRNLNNSMFCSKLCMIF